MRIEFDWYLILGSDLIGIKLISLRFALNKQVLLRWQVLNTY